MRMTNNMPSTENWHDVISVVWIRQYYRGYYWFSEPVTPRWSYG